MEKPEKLKFKLINYIGLLLLFSGVVLNRVIESSNPIIMAAPIIVIIIGIFLTLKGRKI